jgi:hypothetical protein
MSKQNKPKTAAATPEAPHGKFPLKPYLNQARTVFEDAQGSNDMGVIADLLEAKATAAKLAEALRETLNGSLAYALTWGEGEKETRAWFENRCPWAIQARAVLAEWKAGQ